MTELDAIRVFLADDHAMVREGIAALVCNERDIAIVGQCGNGLDVVEEVARTEPDVVVLDVTMPGLNGIDVCRELRRKIEGLGILVLTMHKDEQLVAPCA